MKKTLMVASLMLLAASMSYAQGVVSVPTTTLTVSVGAEAAIVVGNTTVTPGTGSFANWALSTPFTYYIRTSASGGTGTIAVQITHDFSTGAGPSVANSASTGDYLTYTCSIETPATSCTGSQTASTTTATPVASFGAGALSAKTGNAANTVAWTLINDPAYAQGSYAATATFTITAL
jgi:hypothetical protein